MTNKNHVWKKRELIGEIKLDTLNDGTTVILKGFRKWWNDGSSCLDIMKYVKFADGKEQTYFPIQHIQIIWDLAKPFLELFKMKT